jgi:anthranilate phosphoribosyltransferase
MTVVHGNQPSWFRETLANLVEKRDLPPGAVRRMMEDWLGGYFEEAEAAALLVALRMKGETAAELAEAAAVLRERMTPLDVGRDVLDTCGTGGDGTGTFNISTAAALVAAAAGVPVVKHGNRAASSRSGSADVLAVLGVNVEGTASAARRCLEEAGLAFCFAPHFHPAMRHLAPVRRRLHVRTLLNCLGPLANPARSPYQLMGVGNAELLGPLSGALALLGTARRALLVCGKDGLDEVSLSGPTLVREVRGGSVTAWEWTPDDFGLAPCDQSVLRADGPEESAAAVREVLDGRDGPALRVVLANAAAALVAAERVATPKEGVARSEEAVRGGGARAVLERLIALSKP